MLFTSITYFIFLFIVVLLYYILPVSYRKLFLIVISIYFYAFINIPYLILLLIFITINYFLSNYLGNQIEQKRRKYILYISLFINLGVLIFFKYLNFIIYNILSNFSDYKLNNDSFLFNLILPLGLSYYTFQSIGYILDVYRGTHKAENKILNFTFFIIFFPKILVGPIERTKHFMPQVYLSKYFYSTNLIEGSKRIFWGLFKKLVVADRISIYQSLIDANPMQHSRSTVLMASLLYTFQVYADFSGYSDIAIGSARLFGYNLLENFNQPFFAKNLSEFWRRWHISLSSWVNDYIFNPIVFTNRKFGTWAVIYALFISFIIIGIWHGASWNFLLFGILHALVLSYEAITKKIRKFISSIIPSSIYNIFCVILIFLFISFTLIIFRSPDLNKSLTIINAIRFNTGKLFFDTPSTLIFILIGCLIIIIYDLQKEYKAFSSFLFKKSNWLIDSISYAFLIIYILIAAVFDGGQFIYFSF